MIKKLRNLSLVKQIVLFVIMLAAAIIMSTLSLYSVIFTCAAVAAVIISIFIIIECFIYRLKVKLKNTLSDRSLFIIGRFFESIGYACLLWGVLINQSMLTQLSIVCLVLYTIGNMFSDLVFSEKYKKEDKEGR